MDGEVCERTLPMERLTNWIHTEEALQRPLGNDRYVLNKLIQFASFRERFSESVLILIA